MTLALSQRRGFGWGVALCGMMWHWLKTPRSGGGECCGGRGQGWSSWPSARREEFPHIGIHRTRHGMPQHPCLRPLLLLSNWQSRLLCFGPPLLAASTRLKTQFFYAELFFRALNSGARAEGLFCMQGLTPAFTLSSSPTTASTTPPPQAPMATQGLRREWEELARWQWRAARVSGRRTRPPRTRQAR